LRSRAGSRIPGPSSAAGCIVGVPLWESAAGRSPKNNDAQQIILLLSRVGAGARMHVLFGMMSSSDVRQKAIAAISVMLRLRQALSDVRGSGQADSSVGECPGNESEKQKMPTSAQDVEAKRPFALSCRERGSMTVWALAAICVLSMMSTPAWSADPMRFWNLTGTTINKLYLAPPGTAQWGRNQCENDKDGAVEADERLPLTGVTAGHYAVKLTDVNGRTCILPDVTLQAGARYAFSLSEADLKECSK
jgi:hypothetical protein